MILYNMILHYILYVIVFVLYDIASYDTILYYVFCYDIVLYD